MKKILMIAFVSMAMLATVSCSKDDDKKSDSDRPTIKGTLWEANVQYHDIPYIGSGDLEAQLYFKADDVCHIDIDLPAAIQLILSGMGIGGLDSGDYGYIFDGNKVVIDMGGGMELEYTGSTLVYHIPTSYAVIVGDYLDDMDIVFQKQ